MTHSYFKKNLSAFLLVLVVGLQFFNYLGSTLIHPNLSKSFFGYTNLMSSLPYLVDWFWITLIGRIFGAYILCKLVNRLGFFYTMRLIILAYIILAISISTFDFTTTILYTDIRSLFVHRFCHAFLVPATFMLPSLFLLDQNYRKPILISGAVCFSIGLSALLIYKYLGITQFAKGWDDPFLYSAILMLICYILFEKYTPRKTTHFTSNTQKLHSNQIFLIASFAGVCGITFSYHFAFIDMYVNKTLINNNCPHKSSFYYYYTILFLILPVAKFVYKNNNFFIPLKFATFCVIFVSIITALIPEMSVNFYIAEQIIFGILVTILIAPCHALVYQICSQTCYLFNGMFLFVSFFSLFSVTPHFFLRLLGMNSLPWLSLIYILPIATLFIIALTKYEQTIGHNQKTLIQWK